MSQEPEPIFFIIAKVVMVKLGHLGMEKKLPLEHPLTITRARRQTLLEGFQVFPKVIHTKDSKH